MLSRDGYLLIKLLPQALFSLDRGSKVSPRESRRILTLVGDSFDGKVAIHLIGKLDKQGRMYCYRQNSNDLYASWLSGLSNS